MRGIAFQKNSVKKIYVEQKEEESVWLAVNDLMKDIRSICGGAELTTRRETADIVVYSDKSRFAHEEEFCYEIADGKITFCGADDLGTMWAIYTFSEKELKIPPHYLFGGIKMPKKETLVLENKRVNEYPHTRFRGWFVNDEDLLTGYKNKGTRNIDYPFYTKVIHPEIMEKIVETALRFRMNLLIPASFLDISNPDEENLIRIASRRGLYVSQHHIEPLGCSHFGMRAFMEAQGYDAKDISFVANRKAMIATWRHYAELWAKYPRVVWQLGLRGPTDIPVWKSDCHIEDSMQARGALIAEAIQTQYDIIKEVTKRDRIYTSSTLWMEGAQLLRDGFLKLPEDTVAVFADIGFSQLFGDDFFTVPRETGQNYGVYYHVQYSHLGPHLAESTLPKKMDYCYSLARERQSDYYSVLNVGNILEFPYSVNLNAKLVWYGNKYSIDDIAKEYCSLYANEYAEELKHAIDVYYDSFGDADEYNYKCFCEIHNFNYHRYEDLPFPVVTINDGLLGFMNHALFEDKCKFFKQPIIGNTITEGKRTMQKAFEFFAALKEKMPEGYKGAMLRGWYYQSYFGVKLLEISAENVKAARFFETKETEGIADCMERAAIAAKDILEKRAQWFDGPWSGWFNDERKVNVRLIYECCLRDASLFRGAKECENE